MKTQTTIRKEWNHKSVRALMRSAQSNDPEQIVRDKARKLVAHGKRKFGWSGPPFKPLELASILGIKFKESTTLFSAEAQLIPIDGRQLLLEFNPDRPSGRRNFTIGHEISHTFFDDCFEIVHQRSSTKIVSDPDEEVEFLCQVGASEIVMPYEDFRSEMGNLPDSLEAIPPLCDLFDVSREACARRYLDLSERQGALVFLSMHNKPVEVRNSMGGKPLPEKKFRVLYSASTSEFGHFIPRDKSISDDSCIYSLTSLDEMHSGTENWNIKGLGLCSVEAIRLPTPTDQDFDPEIPTVVALIQPI